MLPYELLFPGTWLDRGAPERDAHQAQAVLYVLESHLSDAALALRLFELDRARPPSFGGRESESDARRRRQMEFEREQTLSPSLSPADRWAASEVICLEVEISMKRERWAAGEIPEAHLFRAIFVYAQAFLFAFDGIGKSLKALADMPGAAVAVSAAHDEFYREFPSLTGVRDSSHHLEDRVRGRDRRGRPLALKPVDNSMVHAPGGALILGSLNGNRYGSTMEDGSYGELEVSTGSLDAARLAIQKAIDSFSWMGPKRHTPHR